MKMRRRSERKKSSDTVQSPIVVKRSERRSRRSPSHSESKKSAKTEDSKSHAANSGGDSKYRSTPRKSRDSTQDETKDSSDTPELTPIKEAASEASSEDPNESGEEGKVVSDEKPERVHDRKKADEDASANTKQNHLEENLQDEMNGISNDGNTTPKTNIESRSREESPDTNCEDSSQVKDEINDQENNNSSDKSEEETESKRTSIRNTERRTQSAERTIETESTNAKCTREFSTSGNENALGHKRKRRWLSKKSSQENSHILAISTDSLKNLISDVHPVPLCDVNLESSPEVEEVVDSEREAGELSPPPVMPRTEKTAYEKEPKLARKNERKGSVGTDDYEYTKSSSSKKPPSCILYITNLVRPFTLLQLKCLLARTGKIVEDGFWIDKIKSKCYVQYETEDEAVETRHALHGVRWPISNPKCLHVDFGTAAEMEKAVASSQDGAGAFGPESGRENRIIGTGWDKDRNEYDEKKTQVGRPVREWDVGKKEEMDSEVERKERGRTRLGEKNDRAAYGERSGKENLRSKDPNDRSESTRKRRSMESNQRRSLSESPSRKNKKKNNDPPLRLLDDLFRKTKTTPCIYWLPLTPEQIAEKEAFRLRRIAEHQERIKQREQEKEKEREREKEREKERERERERRRERERSVGHRRSASRDKRRY